MKTNNRQLSTLAGRPNRQALLRAVFLAAFALALSAPTWANSTNIAFAGFAYAGNANTLDARFHYSRRYDKALTAAGSSINAKLRRSLTSRQFPFTLNLADSAESKGDEVLVTALMITGETVSDERIGAAHKLFVQIRAQALIFDFTTKKVRRTYPLSFAYLDALDHVPSDGEIDERIAKAFEGTQGKQGIFGRYADALASSSLPHVGELFLQITQVTIAADAAPAIRPELSAVPGAAEIWLADHFGEALNSKAGVALFPYTAGYAIGGVMQMRLADTDYNLQFPKPDWAISLNLTGVKKVKYAENAAGASYVYGSYATVKIAEPDGLNPLLDAQFKNGEVKEVPANQTTVDDYPAYNDSIRGLFDKLAEVLGGQNLPWLKNAAVTPNIDKEIVATRGLLQKCK
jgi:hypothetical protein